MFRPPLPCALCVRLGREALIGAADLLDQGADPLGLLERVVHHLLQVIAIAGGMRKLMAVLLDLAHVEQERGQRSVELTRDGRADLIHGTGPRRGQPDDFVGVAALTPVR